MSIAATESPWTWNIPQKLYDASFDPPGEERERALALACRSGDSDARRELVLSNLRLAISVAKSYRGFGVDLPDLISAAVVGVCEAAERYETDRHTRFTTYATIWARSMVRAELARSPMVTPPNRFYWEHVKHRGAAHGEVLVMRRARSTHERDTDGVAFDAVDESHRVESGLDRIDEQTRVSRAVDLLPPRTAHVIRGRYGLGCDVKKLRELADELGLTKEGVRVIQRKGESLLRDILGDGDDA